MDQVAPFSPVSLLLSWKSWAFFLISYVMGVCVYNLYLHPLAAYPGPWYARVSRLCVCYHLFIGDLHLWTKSLHERYGPVVRLASDELSFMTADVLKDIYGHRAGKPENEKDISYRFDPKPEHASIVNADRARHTQLRRLLSNAFSDKVLQGQEPVIRKYTDLLITKLSERCRQGDSTVDLVNWYNFTTFDIIGHLAFAESFNCLESTEYHAWISLTLALLKNIARSRSVLRLDEKLAPLFMRLSALLNPSLPKCHRELYRLTQELVARRQARNPEYTDFMTHLIAAQEKGQLIQEDLHSNAPVIVVAGSETTATLLSGATYYLLSHPEVHEKLKKEVRGAFNSADEVTIERTGSLPYLLAVLDESLRLYPPGSNPHLRRTPPAGAVLGGKFVPGNTAVGMNQYALHRSKDNFARAEEFIPERWIDRDQEPWKNDRRDVVQPFSFGPRNCIGRNLAYIEMRLILAKVLCTFDMELAPETKKDWLSQNVFVVWEKHPLLVNIKLAKDI
ncbi:cytochrome p450 [Diplodia corticola]|uniref:Cytochrome p450 n=1 Tax=Diplodia corticola TaxID=236234 RepID=A0A1J9RFE9_9PEZI|nr:cytochrome p450 [Diplodia corticola]OJD38810.1 cytochrome p450 [Diplodia corticola]